MLANSSVCINSLLNLFSGLGCSITRAGMVYCICFTIASSECTSRLYMILSEEEEWLAHEGRTVRRRDNFCTKAHGKKKLTLK